MGNNRAYLWIIIVVCVGLIVVLFGRVKDLYSNLGKIDVAEAEVAHLAKQNLRLSQELEKTQEDDYIEEVARNQLQFSYSDETVLLLPSEIPAVVEEEVHKEGVWIESESWWDRVFRWIDGVELRF